MAAPIPQDYSFGNRSAHYIYDDLCRDREGVVEKARELAKISIPYLFPPEGYRPGDTLPPPNQSINARCIVNLSSRIMYTALPPSKPILKYNIIEHKMKGELDADPQLYAETKLALAARERANRERLEATSIRSAYVQAASQLILAGNLLWKQLDINYPSVHRCDTYVVKRNATGQQLFNILKQVVNLNDLDAATRAFIENTREFHADERAKAEFTDEVVVYACCKLHQHSKNRRVWLYWEETETGEMIPDTDVMCEFDAPPQYAAWMIPNFGHNWGTSYCQQYEGDMYIVENTEGALNDGAEAAALTWIFVKPGGVTSARVLKRAENLKVMNGDASDITVFRLDKNNDFAWVAQRSDAAARRLGAAFLMVSSIQRNAERVTAEEWRMMASELDQAMGGLYSELAQGMGRNIVMRFLALQHEEDPSLKPLPEGLVRVGVITGIDALGLSDEEANLENALGVIAKLVGPAAMAQILQATNIAKRVFAGNSVNPSGLVKEDDQQKQEMVEAQQTQLQGDVVRAATPALAKEGAAAASQVITPQMMQALQQQQQQQM